MSSLDSYEPIQAVLRPKSSKHCDNVTRRVIYVLQTVLAKGYEIESQAGSTQNFRRLACNQLLFSTS